MFRPVALSGSSGAGKTTLKNKLMEKYKNCFQFSVSHTSRPPREEEIEGKDYYFVTKEVMEKEIKENRFFEYVEYAGNLYGTHLNEIEKFKGCNKIPILDVDFTGSDKLKNSNVNARLILIYTSTNDILKERLKIRKTECNEKITERMNQAEREIELSKNSEIYDLKILNDNLEEAFKELETFLQTDLKILGGR